MAFFIHHLKEVTGTLTPNAAVDLEAAYCSELAQGRVRQCGNEVLHSFWVSQCGDVMKFGVHSERLNFVSIFRFGCWLVSYAVF